MKTRFWGVLLASACSAETQQQSYLVDGSLVSTVAVPLYADANEFYKVRAVKLRKPDDTIAVHLDVYNGTDGELMVINQHVLLEGLKSMEKEFAPSRAELETWALSAKLSKHWSFGSHPGIQCQVDLELSIADNIRSGRFILNLMTLLPAQTTYEATLSAINVGAGLHDETEDTDPLELWAQRLAAKIVMIDPDEQRLRTAAARTRPLDGRRPAELVALAVKATPSALELGDLGSAIVAALGGSREVDLVKVDIDSFDCQVLRALLLHVEAAVIVLESQPTIPPPIKFARQYHPEDPVLHGLVGCSLSYQVRMLFPKYVLLVYSEDDVVFVRSDIAASLQTLHPTAIFSWSSFPWEFPVDEVDCFRRSRLLWDLPREAGLQENRTSLPIDFVREWAFGLDPAETLAKIWGNLSAMQRHVPGADFSAVLYSLDL